MKIKIIKIKGCKTCAEVLIHLDKNDNGESFVRLVAWHRIKGQDYIQIGEVDYCNTDNDMLMNERIIADFSELSANEFANSFKP